jgi:protein involved in temperature-dependent protein secretion
VQSNKRIKLIWRTISELIANKNFQEAEIKAIKYINAYPHDITCVEYLVEIYQRTSNYSKAIYYQQMYISIIQLNKTNKATIVRAMQTINALKAQLTLNLEH